MRTPSPPAACFTATVGHLLGAVLACTASGCHTPFGGNDTGSDAGGRAQVVLAAHAEPPPVARGLRRLGGVTLHLGIDSHVAHATGIVCTHRDLHACHFEESYDGWAGQTRAFDIDGARSEASCDGRVDIVQACASDSSGTCAPSYGQFGSAANDFTDAPALIAPGRRFARVVCREGFVEDRR